MATIVRVPSTKDGGKPAYRAQIRVRGRAPESKTFPNRKEAKAWADSVESAIREGRDFPHAAARRTSFDALCEDYAKTVLADAREGTRAARTEQLKWWAAHFAGKTLAELTRDAVARGRDALAAETFTRGKPHEDKKTGEIVAPKQYQRSGATVNRYLAALSHVLSFAVKERRLLDRNPVADIAKKKEARGRTRFLSDDERTALLDACAKSEWQPLQTLVLMALATGARRGELLTLRWADVELKTGRALVRETKNGEQRTLPLAGRALESLRELRLRGGAHSAYVFPAPNGRDEPAEHIDAYWYAALEAAGISDFHFHDLRHTTASMLAAQGASLLEIADVLGHKTLAMVKRYSHLVVDHKARVIEKMLAAKGL
ncbi:MAG TPA: site-specific integrase [Steroidobacteraceae bacterium]|nr:site-specific integrase [Steroidobacteraceae bacterium]